jgi:glyoxylase-like metal-dependent hydrolase (beta-lactamase superfamily II)
MIILSLTVILTGATALAADRKKPTSKRPVVPALKVHTHTAATDSFMVNSYLLETAKSVILIDTQLTIPEADKVKELLTKIGKPLAAIFITHPYPEHYNNIGSFLKTYPNVPVYATTATIKAISDNDARLRAKWSKYYYNDYPMGLTLPTHTVKAGESLTIDNVTLIIDEMGGDGTQPATLIYLPATKGLFVGDLVYSGLFANIREGHASDWLSNLQQASKKYPSITTVYPGHGPSGNQSLLTTQATYLTKLRTLISSRFDLTQPREPISAEGKQYVRSTMAADYKTYKCYLLLEVSIEPVTKELLAEIGYKPKPIEDDEDEE